MAKTEKKKLVIVESPAKAKTIEKYLGSGYKVIASMGHLRDLPKSTLGVDVENNFEPHYIAVRDRSELISELKKAVKSAETVYLATDPDREGEAISWHLKELLDIPESKAKRVTFNEITGRVVRESINNPRDIDIDLVNAQQARRVLDRLVGYEVSPILWRKIKRGLSAGRVQSVATRMVVDRENEIRGFTPKEFWLLDVLLSKEGEAGTFTARFYGKNGKKTELTSRDAVQKVLDTTAGNPYKVSSVKPGEKKRSPSPPFITSSLQQEASRRLNMTPKRTMSVAQRLYEGIDITGQGTVGLITYMRTDSLRISEEALAAAGSFIKEKYGDEYYSGPRRYKTKNGAQDAHEAIRPTDINLTPAAVRADLSQEQYRLYSLIWKRFCASQMSNAVYSTVGVEIDNSGYTFKAGASEIVFPGYTKVYEESRDEESEEICAALPALKCGDLLKAEKTTPAQQFTQPPTRYTEATLIRALEEEGIGRPSTYAPTMTTIQSHNYVMKEGRFLVPTALGEVVNTFMGDKFPDIVDLKFTNIMESKLDGIESGNDDWHQVIADFYDELYPRLNDAKADTTGKIKVPEEQSEEKCPECGRNLVYRNGRFGRFLACPGYPECSYTMPIIIEMPGKCPKCGSKIHKRTSPKGHNYYACERGKDCGFMTWEVPTENFCPECGKTLFKPSGRGALKSFCINEDCKAFVPEDKRSYHAARNAAIKKKAAEKKAAAEAGTEAKKPAKKAASKKASSKKTAAKKKA